MFNNLKNKRNIILLGCMLSSAFASTQSLAEKSQAQSLQGSATQKAVQNQAIVNVNTATAAEIANALKGVGVAKAEAIVAFRNLNGTFLQLEELAQVKGIGAATLEKNRAVIRLQ